ncbi:small conductance mechanosensitive channel [Streptomyces sp. DSM 42143]|uniref:mechanosensitive ion channel family protein n=1 Tax=Streptomyces TaxID=1883 RepID=UPI000BD16343|nr:MULTISPECIES: mechanosensitive ion channel family protein [Streptomyces]MCZ9350177.1 mechanosensitive ion channel family protein [Streptomyces mutabilis]MDN3251427.1 mechanosensitive ion channel family protein [Streptomyces sp. MA25(2023)]MDQ0387774.1 small conductance mechanosensitive channel [Streptomyces sp. DSM 42143]PAK22700.1 mechanosensitive ion channel protein MscS [Streptomyces sp. alain-838]
MSLSAAVLLAAGPSPSPSPSESSTPAVPSFQDAQESASNAAGWVEENWSTWLAIGLRVLLIVVIAAVLRVVVRRAITKLIDRMNRRAGTGASTALSGLLVNAERRRQRSEAIGSVLRSVASFLILGTAALMVLGTFQINLAPLLASAGVAGVAIGFGARNLVTDFLSGVFMILEDQYGVGDSIDAGVASGEVIEVGLRVTKLRGDNGEIWYVRNGEVKRIGNLSQGWSTAGVDVTVRSDEDLEKVRETIAAVGERMSKEEPWNEMLWGPIEVLGLDSVLLDSMVVRVSAKTMPGKSLTVERELRWRIKRAFDAAGIPIVGRPEVPGQEAAAPDPTAGMAAPSAYSSTVSPQSVAASPIPPPSTTK